MRITITAPHHSDPPKITITIITMGRIRITYAWNYWDSHTLTRSTWAEWGSQNGRCLLITIWCPLWPLIVLPRWERCTAAKVAQFRLSPSWKFDFFLINLFQFKFPSCSSSSEPESALPAQQPFRGNAGGGRTIVAKKRGRHPLRVDTRGQHPLGAA